MRPQPSRVSLLGRFAAMGVTIMLVLGLAIGITLKRQIESRALERTAQTAAVMTQLAVQPHVTVLDLGGPLTLRRLDDLDRAVQTHAFREMGVERVKLFNRDSIIVYSDEREILGENASQSPGVQRALAGGIASKIERGTDDDGHGVRTLEVYLPLQLRPGGEPEGALELYQSYEPVAADIRTDVVTVYALLGGGFLVVFLALFRIVQGASRKLRHLALHDALTDLPNRSLLYRRAERVLRGEGLSALMLIDLDRFKEVNDTLGHDYGDELLVEVAGRLRAVLRRSDVLARLGGDEFAVLLTDLPHRGAVAELAQRLQDALRRPFALRGIAVELEASIGVALCPDHGRDVGTLVQRADVAMYDAKRSQSGLEAYTADRDPYSADRLGLLAELRRALAEDELVLHYQPKVALGSGDVIGVEALVRWQHPSRGLLPPADFVPLAERTGTVAELTRWVLSAALRQCRAWRDAGLDLPIAVNLAAANVLDVNLPDAVAELLDEHGVPGSSLECEISEHTMMADPMRATDVLSRLRDLGVRLSLDDFGTGHSSLAYLKRLPLDEVKIDRSFVAGMAEDENDAVIVRSTIDLARNLGLDVVAEGVETEAIMNDLAALSCDVVQGFFVSRPLPAASLESWLRAQAVSVRRRGPARKPSASSASS